MLSETINFIVESERLKSVIRQTKPIGISRVENSAEHSWTVALAASVLIPVVAAHCDQLRVTKMLLIHDLVEIDAGDTFCYAEQDGKSERENKAAIRLFSLLPDNTSKEFYSLWKEFEEVKTEEAKLANAIDRILPLIQNYNNGGENWIENDISYDQVYQRNKQIDKWSSDLWEYAEKLIIAARSEGMFPEHQSAEESSTDQSTIVP